MIVVVNETVVVSRACYGRSQSIIIEVLSISVKLTSTTEIGRLIEFPSDLLGSPEVEHRIGDLNKLPCRDGISVNGDDS